MPGSAPSARPEAREREIRTRHGAFPASWPRVTTPRLRARALAAAVALLLGWRVAVSVAGAASELMAAPLPALLAGLGAPEEERVRNALGEEGYEVYCAARDLVPEDQPLLVFVPGRLPERNLAAALFNLLHPRRVSIVLDPQGVAGGIPYSGELVPHALDLDSGAALSWERQFEPLASGPRWRLWRWKAAP